MVEKFRVTLVNRTLSEIVSRVITQFKQMCYFVYLHFLGDWGLKLDEAAIVKTTVRVREKRAQYAKGVGIL